MRSAIARCSRMMSNLLDCTDPSFSSSKTHWSLASKAPMTSSAMNSFFALAAKTVAEAHDLAQPVLFFFSIKDKSIALAAAAFTTLSLSS